MEIQFLYFDECPSHEEALARLQQVMTDEGVDAPVNVIQVESEEQASTLKFAGSPTILVNGEDIVATDEPFYGLSCRVYQLEDGRISPLPSTEMIRQKLRAHKHS